MSSENKKVTLSSIWSDSIEVAWELIKIIVPISIVVKLIQELGLIPYFSIALEPVMSLVGLPGELGIVWATAMLTNLYAGILIFFALAVDLNLSVAQVSVLGSLMLIAHSLGVEMAVARRCGVKLQFTGIIRVGGAILYGIILNYIYTEFSYLQDPVTAEWIIPTEQVGVVAWIFGEVKKLVCIFVIVFLLHIALEILKRIKLTDLFDFLYETSAKNGKDWRSGWEFNYGRYALGNVLWGWNDYQGLSEWKFKSKRCSILHFFAKSLSQHI